MRGTSPPGDPFGYPVNVFTPAKNDLRCWLESVRKERLAEAPANWVWWARAVYHFPSQKQGTRAKLRGKHPPSKKSFKAYMNQPHSTVGQVPAQMPAVLSCASICVVQVTSAVALVLADLHNCGKNEVDIDLRVRSYIYAIHESLVLETRTAGETTRRAHQDTHCSHPRA